MMDTGTYMPPKGDGRNDVRIRLEHGLAVPDIGLGPWAVVGHCQRCGMPMFVNRLQVGPEHPPYVHRTCRCFRRTKEHPGRWA